MKPAPSAGEVRHLREDAREERLADLIHDRDEDVLTRLEVHVELAAREPGAIADGVEAWGVEPLLDEELERAVADAMSWFAREGYL